MRNSDIVVLAIGESKGSSRTAHTWCNVVICSRWVIQSYHTDLVLTIFYQKDRSETRRPYRMFFGHLGRISRKCKIKPLSLTFITVIILECLGHLTDEKYIVINQFYFSAKHIVDCITVLVTLGRDTLKRSWSHCPWKDARISLDIYQVSQVQHYQLGPWTISSNLRESFQILCNNYNEYQVWYTICVGSCRGPLSQLPKVHQTSRSTWYQVKRTFSQGYGNRSSTSVSSLKWCCMLLPFAK